MKIYFLFILGCSVIPRITFSCVETAHLNKVGFLKNDHEINSYDILPPPPSYQSTAFLNDKANYEYSLSLINSNRWQQAKKDADVSDDAIGKQFSSSLGLEISKKNTPKLHGMLVKLREDNNHSISYAKKHYMRVRPFVLFDKKTCNPGDENFLRTSGSYPSAHATLGWEFALILSEMVPERSTQILKRGYDYGQSRVICGFHWQSDVDAGRIIGAAILSRLRTHVNFNNHFDEARQELRGRLFNEE